MLLSQQSRIRCCHDRPIATRSHRAIENEVLWLPTRGFAKDESWVRTGHADQNLAELCNPSPSQARLDKRSIRIQRKCADLST